MATLEELMALQKKRQTVNASLDELIAVQSNRKTKESGGSFFQENIAPVIAPLSEFAAAANRGALGFAESLTVDPINAALQLSGAESRIPKLSESDIGQAFTKGDFVEPGLSKDILRTAGEIAAPGAVAGSLARGAASQIPKLAKSIEGVGTGILRQLGTGTAVGDVALSAASGVGQEIGREVGGEEGALVGSFLAPVSATAAKGVFDKGASSIRSFFSAAKGMSDDGASKLLAEAMVREGMSPDEVAKRLTSLGDEAIPADIGNNFARLLRTASNKIPRIEGEAASAFKSRQSGQGDRILSALDDATGTATLNVDDEIVRLNNTIGPKVTQLYAKASEGVIDSPKLNNLLKGDNSASRALKKAQIRINDKLAAGDEIGQIDIINAAKQQMDDQIGKALRQGENNTARDLVRLKNIMVDEADKAVPAYKEARDLFAGKASLENAADSGRLFFKMKPSDVRDITKTMSESERRFFKLGAKDSILEKIDGLQFNADAVKRLFGKNGDTKKLRLLFDDDQAFNRFNETLKREADFVLTRRAAQANSTTAKQLSDEVSSSEIINSTTQALSSPVGAASVIGRVIGGLSKGKSSQEFTKSLEDAGDILLTKGLQPEKVQRLISGGNKELISKALRAAIKRKPLGLAVPTIAGGLDAQLDPQQNQQQTQ